MPGRATLRKDLAVWRPFKRIIISQGTVGCENAASYLSEVAGQRRETPSWR